MWYGYHVRRRGSVAGIAQLVEHNLAKVGVAGSSPVSRSAGGSAALSRFVWRSENVLGKRRGLTSRSRCGLGRLAQLVRAPR